MSVRTVLGAVAAAELGVTYAHEHLILDSPLIAERFPHIHLPSVEDAVTEVSACRAAGVRTMVDAMPSGQGRDVGRLAEVARRTGMHIVAATGLHTEKYYPDVAWAREDPAEALAERFVAELTRGADGTDHCCGVIKVATDERGMTPRAQRLFAAAAMAHGHTGAPILTHCEGGVGGLEQVEALSALGIPLDRVALSHTDKVADLSYHRALLEAGVVLEYDQALRQDPDERRGTAWLIATLVADGYGDQIVLGTDGARRSLWTALGGAPGLDWLAAGFGEVLARWGVDADAQQRMFIANPARWLTGLGGG